VERILEKQRIISWRAGRQDVVALASGDSETCAQVFFFRSRETGGPRGSSFSGDARVVRAVMTSFLQQFYESSPHVPAEELSVEVEPDDRTVIQELKAPGRSARALRRQRSPAVTEGVPKRAGEAPAPGRDGEAEECTAGFERQRIKW